MLYCGFFLGLFISLICVISSMWLDIRTLSLIFIVVLLMELIWTGLAYTNVANTTAGTMVVINEDWFGLSGSRGLLSLVFDSISCTFTFILLLALILCFIFLAEYFEYDYLGTTIMTLSATFSQLAFVYFCVNDILLIFVVWELISIVSFFLIRFWSFSLASVKAALKVFVISQLGDFLFVISTIVLIVYAGSSDCSLAAVGVDLCQQSVGVSLGFGVFVSIKALVALGIIAAVLLNSAQFIFFPWLLDAMEAPVPISAQLHSSTLVIIGFYLVFSFWPILGASESVLISLIVVGTCTSLTASLLGFVQDDGKRLLACSTAGQLGYVITALGLGLTNEALFLLMFCCCNKAYTFVWFGIAMTRVNGLSDFSGLFTVRFNWLESVGVASAVINTTIAPGAFAWHVKATLLDTASALTCEPLIVLAVNAIGLTWALSSAYLTRLLVILGNSSVSTGFSISNSHSRVFSSWGCEFGYTGNSSSLLYTVQLVIWIALGGLWLSSGVVTPLLVL